MIVACFVLSLIHECLRGWTRLPTRNAKGISQSIARRVLSINSGKYMHALLTVRTVPL